MAGGRPSSYTAETATEIAELLSDGMSLRTICAREGMPTRVTVFKWLREYPEFLSQYTHAREAAADGFAEDIIEIADTATNKEDAPAIKVRVDARIWVASKLKPKVYGNHQAVAITGSENGPLQIVVASKVMDL